MYALVYDRAGNRRTSTDDSGDHCDSSSDSTAGAVVRNTGRTLQSPVRPVPSPTLHRHRSQHGCDVDSLPRLDDTVTSTPKSYASRTTLSTVGRRHSPHGSSESFVSSLSSRSSSVSEHSEDDRLVSPPRPSAGESQHDTSADSQRCSMSTAAAAAARHPCRSRQPNHTVSADRTATENESNARTQNTHVSPSTLDCDRDDDAADPIQALLHADTLLAQSYRHLWELQDAPSAIDCLRRAHRIQMDHLGESHQQTGWTCNFLGLAYWQKGITERADRRNRAGGGAGTIQTSESPSGSDYMRIHTTRYDDYLQALDYFSQSRRSVVLHKRGTTYEHEHQKTWTLPGRTLSMALIRQRITTLLRDYLGSTDTAIQQYHRTWNMAMECEFRALTFANQNNLTQARKIYKKSQSMFSTLHRGIAQSVVSKQR